MARHGRLVVLLSFLPLVAVAVPLKLKLRHDLRSHGNTWAIFEPSPHSNATTAERAWVSSDSKFVQATEPLWNHDQVRHAVVVESLEQFGPLFQKLHSGQPIRVLADGSSLTQWQGGCFHTGSASDVPSKMGARGGPTWSNLYRDDLDLQMPYTSCLTYKGHGVGWATSFMQVLNRTFPHANHTLLNAGRAGTKLSDFADLGCLEEHLPATLDLLVLENVAALSGGPKVEQLLWKVLQYYAPRQPARPAVIILNSAFIFADYQEPESGCIVNMTRCDSECGNLFRTTVSKPSFYSEKEGQLTALAQFYGVTFISHRAFLYNSLFLRREHTRRDMNVCRWLGLIHSDRLHLNGYGRLLFAHYILHVLDAAEHHLLAEAAAAASSIASSARLGRGTHAAALANASSFTAGTGGGSHGHGTWAGGAGMLLLLTPVVVPLPPHELFAYSWRQRQTRCPELVDASDPHLAAAAAAAVAMRLEAPEQDVRVPGPGAALGLALLNGSMALVTHLDGWKYAQRQATGATSGEGMQKYKPGWVASTVGATLRLKVNTVMEPSHALDQGGAAAASTTSGTADGPGLARPGASLLAASTSAVATAQAHVLAVGAGMGELPLSAELGQARQGVAGHVEDSGVVLLVSFLASWQHMGVASVTCVSGCTCQAAQVDAHITQHMSVFQTARLHVSPSPQCEVQLQVLPRSSSGEHMWKLISVTVSDSMDVQGFEDNFGGPFKPDLRLRSALRRQ